MKKKLTMLIFLFPVIAMAQSGFNNGTLTIDFGKKKPKQEDTTQQQQQPVQDDEQEDNPKPKKEKKQKTASTQKQVGYDFKKEGLFKGLIHVGMNGSQVDGDGYAGYNLLGFEGGVGALVRFHKFLSFSVELNYTMKGAKQKFVNNPNTQTLQMYRLQWDYMEVPIGINIHDNRVVMFGLGLVPAVMVRYKEQDEQGQDDTNNPPNGPPSRFDLSAYAQLNFVIKKNYMIGGKFDYSLIKVRGPQYPGTSRLLGEYNNVITLRFMVVLDKTLFKKQ